MQTARAAAQGIAGNLAIRLESQRAKAAKAWRFSKDELLEMNALIYAVPGTTPATP